MSNWARLGSEQRIAGRINLDVAPFCAQSDGGSWLYLLDIGSPVALPRRQADPTERVAFQRIRQSER